MTVVVLDVLFESAAKLPVKVMIVGGNNVGEIRKWKHKARALGAHNVYFCWLSTSRNSAAILGCVRYTNHELWKTRLYS